jgi:hypothetical protein
MAQGNWSKYNPKARCYKCGYVIKGEVKHLDVSVNGTPIHAVHPACYDKAMYDAAKRDAYLDAAQQAQHELDHQEYNT